MRRTFDLHELLDLACSADNPFICFANATIPLLYAPVATAFHTTGILFIPTASGRRIQLYEAEFGQAGTLPTTDGQDQWDLSRFASTAVAAGTSVTAQLLDPADAACVTLALNNLTAEPTYTTQGNGLSLKSWAINMRGSYRWRTLDDGDNILVAAAAGVGIGIRTLGTQFAASAVGTLTFIER